jgi:hypothetical protein
MLGARKRSWIMAVVRIGITIVSTLISIPVSKAIASSVVGLIAEPLISEMGSEFLDLYEKVPAGGEGLEAIVSLLLAPILFIFVFLIIRFLISLVMWIVEKFVPVLKKRSKLYMTMPLGALNGILIGMVTLIPLCGFMAFGGKLLYTLEDAGILDNEILSIVSDDEMDEDAIVDLSDEMENTPIVKVVHGTIGKPVFKALTTTKLHSSTGDYSVKINLENEFIGLINVLSKASDAIDSFKKDEYSKRDKEDLFALVDSMFESDWLSLVMTDTLVAMSESWLDNETFMGIKRPVLDSTLNPTVNCVLEIMADEDPETLEEDLRIVLDVMGDLMINNILMDDMGYETLVERLGKDSLLTDLLAKLDESPRLHVLSVELKNLSIRLVTNMLGTELLESGEYDEMMEDVAASLTDVLDMSEKERDAIIIKSIQENFKKEGYDVPEDVALEMSNKMIDELGEDGVITSDELKQYMVSHAEEGFDIADDVIPDKLPDDLPNGKY